MNRNIKIQNIFYIVKVENLYNLINVFNKKKLTKNLSLCVSYVFPKFDGS
jgi:hypothetical protein